MRKYGAILSGVVLAALMMAPVAALGGSQAFNVAGAAQPGMLVSLGRDSGTVQAATAATASQLVGVLTASNPALDAQPGQVSVQTDGVAQALVSTLNGDVHSGDRIAPSSLQGVGAVMNGAGWAVGTAQAAVNATTKGAVSTIVTDSHGVRHTVYVAGIPVLVKVFYYSPPAAQQSKLVPAPVQHLADALAGKHASWLAVVLGFVLILIGLVVAGFIISSAVRGALEAIARQPLAKFVIIRRMLQAIIMGVGLLVGSLLGAFLLLRIL